MRKQVFGRQLQRDTNERKALFKSLMESLVVHESITTTEAKAKAVRGQMEKLVTKARKGGLKAERLLQSYFHPEITKKLINEIAPRFMNRPGGYTRIIRIGNRTNDNATMVLLEWVEKKSGSRAADVQTDKEIKQKSSNKLDNVKAETAIEKKEKTKETKKEVKSSTKKNTKKEKSKTAKKTVKK